MGAMEIITCWLGARDYKRLGTTDINAVEDVMNTKYPIVVGGLENFDGSGLAGVGSAWLPWPFKFLPTI